jgi:hypothetical protein
MNTFQSVHKVQPNLNLSHGFLNQVAGKPWFELSCNDKTTVIVATSLHKLSKPVSDINQPGHVRVGKVLY